jgi:thiosulfate dehydrogenase [quinone] large subunit
MVKHARPGGPIAADLALLPLRLFLAVVYLDGGIGKIADTRFLDSASPQSMHAAVLAARTSSPIGGLLGPVQAHSTVFGVFLALAEVAVGLGTLFGVFHRVAVVGGMLLALSLWLTVSWDSSPWFTSADVVYLFAFTPLLIAGAGNWSVDAQLARIPVQPDRRRLLVVGGAVAALGALLLGGAALARRGSRTTPRAADRPKPGGEPLIAAADVPVGKAVQVTDTRGDPVWVLQLKVGSFTAYDGRCPHQGCTVRFVSAEQGFVCPCHRSHFDPSGRRIDGPAPRGLAPIRVKDLDGQLRTG